MKEEKYYSPQMEVTPVFLEQVIAASRNVNVSPSDVNVNDWDPGSDEIWDADGDKEITITIIE